MNHSLNEEKPGADTFYSNPIGRAKAVLFGLWIDDVYPQRLPEVFIQKSIPIKGKLWMWIESEPFQKKIIIFKLNSMSTYIFNSIFFYYVIFFETMSTGLIKKDWGHYEMHDISQFNGVLIITLNMPLTAQGWCNEIIIWISFCRAGKRCKLCPNFF